MSGAFSISTKHEMSWELKETKEQRRQRARALRAIYALCDPDGWDGRRAGLGARVRKAARMPVPADVDPAPALPRPRIAIEYIRQPSSLEPGAISLKLVKGAVVRSSVACPTCGAPRTQHCLDKPQGRNHAARVAAARSLLGGSRAASVAPPVASVKPISH